MRKYITVGIIFSLIVMAVALLFLNRREEREVVRVQKEVRTDKKHLKREIQRVKKCLHNEIINKEKQRAYITAENTSGNTINTTVDSVPVIGVVFDTIANKYPISTSSWAPVLSTTDGTSVVAYTVPRKGPYLVSYTINAEIVGTFAFGMSAIGVNGNIPARSTAIQGVSNADNLVEFNKTFIVHLNAGDIINLFLLPINGDLGLYSLGGVTTTLTMELIDPFNTELDIGATDYLGGFPLMIYSSPSNSSAASSSVSTDTSSAPPPSSPFAAAKQKASTIASSMIQASGSPPAFSKLDIAALIKQLRSKE